MRINASSNTFWSDRSGVPGIEGHIKTKVEDFRVYEKETRDTFVDTVNLDASFTPISASDIVLVSAAPGLGAAHEQLIDVADFMHNADCLPELQLLNAWIESFDCEGKIPEDKITFNAPASKENRKLIYEYLKQRYPFCVAEKNTTEDGEKFVVTADTSLLPLFRAGLALADVVAMYRFIGQGPLAESAGRGIAIGKGLDRAIRTAVYKTMSKLCPQLDAKTMDDRETGVRSAVLHPFSLMLLTIALFQLKKQQLFWRRSVRERVQRQSERDQRTAAPAQEGSNIDTNSASLAELGKRGHAEGSTPLAVNPPKKQRVTERVPTDNGPLISVQLPRYLKFVLVKNNVEQSEAFRLLANVLNSISRHYVLLPDESVADLSSTGLLDKSYLHSFSHNGTKDKRGITTQHCCLDVLPAWINKNNHINHSEAPVMDILTTEQRRYVGILEAAAKCLLSINSCGADEFGVQEGIAVGNITYSHMGLSLGQHWGNRFNIIIRDLAIDSRQHWQNDRNECAVCVLNEKILPSVDRAVGFPNFFGTQRFGVAGISNGADNATPETERDLADVDSESIETSSDDDEYDNAEPQSETAREMPVGPQVGKFLIQSNYIAATRCLLLGNSYQYDEANNVVTDRCRWACKRCVDLTESPKEKFVSRKSLAVKEARNLYAFGAKPSLVHKKLPSHMTKERWLLQGLARYCGDKNILTGASVVKICQRCNCTETIRSESSPPGSVGADQSDHKRAFETIPFLARTMWIHAYGSWLWNAVVDFRLFHQPTESETSRFAALRGDLLQGKVGGKEDVRRLNIAENDDNADVLSVVLPLIGSNVKFPGGLSGMHYKSILIDDGFDVIDIFDEAGSWESFTLKILEGLPKGAYRNVVVSSSAFYLWGLYLPRHDFSSFAHYQQFPTSASHVEWAFDDSSGADGVTLSSTGSSTLSEQQQQVENKSGSVQTVESQVVHHELNCAACHHAIRGSSPHPLRFIFNLPVGSYATVFLREVLGCDKML